MDQHPCTCDEELETNSNFVDFEKVEMGTTSNNIETIILNAMGGMGVNEAMASKWLCLRCNGDFVLQGIQIGVITQT
jgi:hypothetical protein